MENKKLKIGVLIDKDTIPLWLYKELDKAKDIAEVSVFIKPANEFKRSLKEKLSDALFFLIRKIDDKITSLLRRNRNNPLSQVSIAKLDINIPVCQVNIDRTPYCDKLFAGEEDKLKAYNCDIFIRAGFRILKGDILKIPKYGIWSIHHGDNRINRGGSLAFWEYIEDHDYTGAILQVLSNDLDGGTVIDRASCRVKEVLTWNMLRRHIFWKASSLFGTNLQKLYNFRGEFMQKISLREDNNIVIYDQKLYRAPKNWNVLLKYFYIVTRKIIKRILRKEENWGIIVKKRNNKNILNLCFRQFKLLPMGKESFWADPFLFEYKGEDWIFFERIPANSNKGIISCVKYSAENKTWGNYIDVLKEDFHLSYPNIFQEGDDIYMIPETYEANQIRLYKCVEFPNKWELHRVLFDGIIAVDTTLWKEDGIYWLFTLKENSKEDEDNKSLHLYYSNNLKDNWIAHPSNPISSNIMNARPGGKLFKHNNVLYRVGQIGTTYGYGIKLMKITKLSTSEYEEIEYETIEPSWDNAIAGIHTLNFNDRWYVADIKSYN